MHKIFKKSLALLLSIAIPFCFMQNTSAVSVKSPVTISGTLYGKSGNLNVEFSSPDGINNIKGIQFTVNMPSGFSVYSVNTNLNDWEIDYSSNRVILSCGNDYESLEDVSNISGNKCSIATLSVKVNDGVKVGKYGAEVTVEDLCYNGGNSSLVNCESQTSYFYYKSKISSLIISGAETSKTYSGSPQTQSIVVMDGTTRLKDGTDYTVTYKNNINAGKADVVIIGKGYYTGIVNKAFTINKKSITSATVSGLSAKYYSGKAIKPNLIVKVGSKILKNETDYTISYSNNTLPGSAKVTIKGIRNYNGSLKKTFKIAIKGTNFKSTIGKSKSVAMKWSKVSNISGYQIRYSTSSKFKKAKIENISKSTVSKTIKKLKSKKKYYVAIRTYKTISGKKYYSNWSTKKVVKTK